MLSGRTLAQPIRSAGGAVRGVALLTALLVFLAGCGPTSDKSGPTAEPTAAAPLDPTIPATAVSSRLALPTVAALTTGNALPVSDGICQARIPFGWLANGAGSGTTPSGGTWTLFGNRLAAPDAWPQAVDLFKRTAADQPGATLTTGDDFVHVNYADDRGFAHRARFADRYCDIRVTSPAANPPQERVYWGAIARSLAPAA